MTAYRNRPPRNLPRIPLANTRPRPHVETRSLELVDLFNAIPDQSLVVKIAAMVGFDHRDVGISETDWNALLGEFGDRVDNVDNVESSPGDATVPDDV